MVLLPPLRRRPSRRGAALVSLSLSALLTGCYAYRATPPGALITGADVRLQLTPEGTATLTESSGLRLQTMQGSLQGVRSDGALMVLPGDVTTIDGDSLPWRRGVLAVPVQALASAQQRTLDRRRTMGFAGVMAGVFTGAVYFTLRSIWGRGGNTVGSGPGTPE